MEYDNSNKRSTGAAYEDLAADYLRGKGYKIIGRNFHCRKSEIDLITRDGRYIVFVEVKYRKSPSSGVSLEAVDERKAARVRYAASVYLMINHYPGDMPVRFDVVGIDGDRITHIENAF